ncbi:MAG: hypothetical protein IJ689_02490 [Alphaproteobacteria bacterium]|nr:hypothetical protein [Alphaproteobacteria bacterium]
MNKYILLLGIAGVALGSYAAYAGNQATMTVTATIAHDVSLTVTQNLDLGTITINPAYTGTDTSWSYSDSGVINYTNQGAIVSADNATLGTFTANVPNPNLSPTGLGVDGNTASGTILNLFGGNDNSNYCIFRHQYRDNEFFVFPVTCVIRNISKVTTGSHEGTLTITYIAR